MARNPVVGRYRLYKEGTAKLVRWLAQTASRCCDISAIIKSSTPAPAPRKAGSSARGENTAIPIRPRELIRLAEAIASASPSVEIPSDILHVARDVIAGRQVCAEWYSGQAMQESSKLGEQDLAHRHFVTVLQDVLVILTDASEKQTASDVPAEADKGAKQTSVPARRKSTRIPMAAESADGPAMANLFSQLEVEEPSASPLGAQPNAQQQKQQPKKVAKDKEYGMAQEDDTVFALWCFLEDLNDVRTYVRDTWREFAAGDVSFVAASMVTDAAFGLMRCADEDFVMANPLFADHIAMMLFLGLSMTIQGHHVWLFSLDEGSSPRHLKAGLDIADLLCPAAATLLRGYTEKLRTCAKCASNPKQGRPQDSDGDTFAKYSFHEFGPVLLKCAHSIEAMTASATSEGKLVDEFVRGMASFGKTAAMRIWLVVACQTYMDIYDIIGSDTSVGLRTLQAGLMKSEDTIMRWDTHMDKFGSAKPVDEELLQFASRNGTWARVLGSEMDAGSQHDNHSSPAYSFLSSLPAHAGVLAYASHVKLHCKSMHPANAGLLILAMAHLYKALRHYGLLNQAWHDMDFVVSQQSILSPLVTKTAATADAKALARHYQMALGVPATSFARNPSLALPESLFAAKKFAPNARKLQVTSRYGRGTIAHQKGDKVRGVPSSNSYELVLQSMTAAEDAKPNSKATTAIIRFTPLTLLATFKKCMIADEPHINFDYSGFWADCEQLLHDMSPVLRKVTINLAHDVQGGCRLVDALLRDAAGVQLRQGSLVNAAISDAGALLADFIKANSTKYTQPAYDQSSGRIPKALRPTFEPRTTCCDLSSAIMRDSHEPEGFKFGSSRRIVAIYDPKATYRGLVAQERWRLEHAQWIRDGCPGDNVPLAVRAFKERLKNGDEDCLKHIESLRGMHEDMNRMDEAGGVRICAMNTGKLGPGERQMNAEELRAEREMTLRALSE
ncbi:hypothetical protein LTR36_010064 [Oleoguttula mirabilis]|uniref:DUF6604 domain-containing protein n=1 Tax=Oleoguttula mirabilis TaxID=1507867 RepID=A0AAV9JRT5_9PEZI|nr:hypothetical protein LTR36_010064 [Oleoguttula mirabilis]